MTRHSSQNDPPPQSASNRRPLHRRTRLLTGCALAAVQATMAWNTHRLGVEKAGCVEGWVQGVHLQGRSPGARR